MVESLSRGYRMIVPEECVADKHESSHFANLTDLMLKYADVVSVDEVHAWLRARRRWSALTARMLKPTPGRGPRLLPALALRRRPKITWPGGARIAFWVAPNIEFYELDPPPQPAPHALAAAAPDVPGYSMARLRQPRRASARMAELHGEATACAARSR